jgi:O-antigen ligase
LIATGGRLIAAAAIGFCVVSALLSAHAGIIPAACALLILGLTLWQPRLGLAATAALAPAGALLAAPPFRAAELFAWTFVAASLVRVWQPRGGPWPRRILVPAALYATALASSWLALTIADAAGVPIAGLPRFLLQSVPTDHLFVPSPLPETVTLLHALAGLALFAAAASAARHDDQTVRALAWAVIASVTVLAAATLVDVGSDWADAGYTRAYLARYLQGERFSLHIGDVNAAGSLYALGIVAAAAYVWLQPAQRGGWIAVLGVLLPALWLAGSRAAYIAAAGGVVLIPALHRQWRQRQTPIVAGALLLAGVVLLGASALERVSNDEGSIRQSASLRAQFLRTTARMVADSPAYGVGVGRYFGRSGEYMTPQLRDIYGNENAHNYFAQQFAELGVVGGALFVWFVVAVIHLGWAGVRASRDDIALHALLAGSAAYLVTCVTGHPLLVPEAALPFWAAFGAVAGGAAAVPRAASGATSHAYRAVAVVVAAVLVLGVGISAAAYARASQVPPEQGFHGAEFDEDEKRFRWMTRRAVTYVPPGPGILRLELQAPDLPATGPVVAEVLMAGRLLDRRELPPGMWITWQVPVRGGGAVPFQRIDLRVNQEWTQEVRLGRRPARRPISVMAGEIAWEALP